MSGLACLTEKAPLFEKYPDRLSSLDRTPLEWSANLLPDVGQNIFSDIMTMTEGTRVRATARATRTPSPTTTPIVLRKTTEVNARERNEIITVAPRGAMLS